MHGVCQFKKALVFQYRKVTRGEVAHATSPEVGGNSQINVGNPDAKRPFPDIRYTCSVQFRSAGGGVSAVGVKNLARHVTRVFAREEQEGRRDFVGLAGAAHRRILAEFGDFFRRLPARWVE